MIINGNNFNFNEISVSDLLSSLELDKNKVVVEVNGEIVMKREFDVKILFEKDKIEIVSFIGGG